MSLKLSAPIEGSAWVFGANVNTDAMAPGHSFALNWDEQRLTLFPERPGWVDQMNNGDIIVAGANWGCGSSREQAVLNLKKLNVSLVVAESFARIFFRNAIANAFPVIVSPGILSSVTEGEKLRFDWSKFRLTNETTQTSLTVEAYTPEMRSIVEAGGMLKVLKARSASKETS